MTVKRLATIFLSSSLLVAASSCGEKGMTYGDPNSIIAVTSPELWDGISQQVYDSLEKTVLTVRDEKTFTVTYQEPYGDYWSDLRRFRQMLLIGTSEDPWIREALDESKQDVSGPGVVRTSNVWSRDQTVTLIILPSDGSVDGLGAELHDVSETLDHAYRVYARNRMYSSGIDSALADTLATQAGFSLLVPDVYDWRQEDSTYLFRNANPDPSELIRELGVTWVSPAMSVLRAEDLLEWRKQLVDAYNEPQDFVSDGMVAGPMEYAGHEAFQIQAQWRNPPERNWPAGGPVILRAVTCDAQDRTYLIDSWLYAPGKEKYEYMIQLETILGTFRCGS